MSRYLSIIGIKDIINTQTDRHRRRCRKSKT
jgi:hypothetical protein